MTTSPATWRSFRCHILRLHHWQTFSTDDGARYRACAVCRREHPGTGSYPGSMAGLGL